MFRTRYVVILVHALFSLCLCGAVRDHIAEECNAEQTSDPAKKVVKEKGSEKGSEKGKEAGVGMR